MAKAVLADDEPIMRAALREQLEMLWPELLIVAEADDGPIALQKIETLKPDVAFLDIRMPGLSGLEVAKAITQSTSIVFVTAFDSHALEAFEANAVDYVLKPVDPVRMARVIAKVKKNLSDGTPADIAQLILTLERAGLSTTGKSQAASISRMEWLQVAVGTQIRMLHVSDVIYFESDTKYTRVVAEDCDGLIRISLKELLESLDSSTFLQTHRSSLVNRRFVHSVHRKGEVVEIELKGRPERLKVSIANHHIFKAM
ncbi:MAG TPA: LytTR family DNA-binding domain-containing protein [Rhodoferax sp.]|nr:LytTR family DNA-binding domain-containing protein [Rhodoferax sp.]